MFRSQDVFFESRQSFVGKPYPVSKHDLFGLLLLDLFDFNCFIGLVGRLEGIFRDAFGKSSGGLGVYVGLFVGDALGALGRRTTSIKN